MKRLILTVELTEEQVKGLRLDTVCPHSYNSVDALLTRLKAVNRVPHVSVETRNPAPMELFECFMGDATVQVMTSEMNYYTRTSRERLLLDYMTLLTEVAAKPQPLFFFRQDVELHQLDQPEAVMFIAFCASNLREANTMRGYTND